MENVIRIVPVEAPPLMTVPHAGPGGSMRHHLFPALVQKRTPVVGFDAPALAREVENE